MAAMETTKQSENMSAPNLRQYQKLKPRWHKLNPHCMWPGCKRKSEPQPHHSRGRLGPLLCDTRFWRAVCFHHHFWIHNHPEEARQKGMLCEKGKWNTPEK